MLEKGLLSVRTVFVVAVNGNPQNQLQQPSHVWPALVFSCGRNKSYWHHMVKLRWVWPQKASHDQTEVGVATESIT